MQRKLIGSLLLLIFIGLSAAGQDNRTLETKVADLLTEIPAENPDELSRIMNTMVQLDAPGLTLIINSLRPDGEGTDLRQRFAIESLSRFISKSMNSNAKSFYNTTVLEAAGNSNLDYSTRIFLIRTLYLTADVPELTKLDQLLASPELFPSVLKVMTSIEDASTMELLYQRLNLASEDQKVQLLKALGDLNYKDNILDIISMVKASGPSEEMAQAGWYIISQSGVPEAYDYMLEVYGTKLHSKLQPKHYFLAYGETALANNNLELSAKVSKVVLASEESNSVKTRAYLLESRRTDNKAKFNKTLVKEFSKSSDISFQNSLLEISRQMQLTESKSSWRKAYSSAGETGKISIIKFFKQTNQPEELHYIRTHLSGIESDALITDLLIALVAVDQKAAIPSILELMRNKLYSKAGKEALMSIVGKDDFKLLGEALPSITDDSKLAIIQVLAAKRAFNYFDEILTLTGDSNPSLQGAAYNALQFICTEKDLEALSEVYSKASGDNRQAASIAIFNALSQIENEQVRNNRALEIIDESRVKGQLISLLSTIPSNVLLQKAKEYYKVSSLHNYAFTAISDWPEATAGPFLFDVYASGDEKLKHRAFNGYLRLANSQNIPGDQRLLMMRKIMEISEDTHERELIIRAAGNVHTPLSLKFVSDFLDDPSLQQSAARAVVRICLPTPKDQNGMSGPQVIDYLTKAMVVIKGDDRDYIVADIMDYLDKMPQDQGYVPMFNGKDLSGWKGYVDNPIMLKKMRSRDLQGRQIEANNKIGRNWKVQDGMITFSGDGQNLLSIKEYGDFELYCDWRISEGGDSGIYLRGTPQVQIWDTSRVEVGAQVGSGGLYNNQKNPSKPLKVADNPIGNWNTFFIRMIGEKVTVYLNGELVVDNVVLENYWDRNQSIFPTGTIELQAHGTNLAFRDIYVKEISSPDFSLTNEEKAEGFVSLFDGATLDGWIGNKTDYKVVDRVIIIEPQGGSHGNLYTSKEYDNFIFRFEFKLTPGANNGLGIHAPLEGDAAYVGKELQILDNTASIYSNLKPYQYHGSIYGVVPAKRGFLKPIGEWNQQEVWVNGNRIKITLNGTVIVDADYVRESINGTMDGQNHPGLQRKRGHIGFLGHGSVLRFRNIRIKEL